MPASSPPLNAAKVAELAAAGVVFPDAVARAGLTAGPNGFGAIKHKLSLGYDVLIYVWADSLSNGALNPREFAFRVADGLAVRYPTSPVYVDTWNVSTSLFDRLTIQAGSGGPSVTLRNFAVPGAIFQYGLGQLLSASTLSTLRPDCMLTCHGHNHVTGTTIQQVMGDFLAALETYRQFHPGVPIVCLLENPQYGNNNMALAFEAFRRISTLRDIALIDGYTPFIAAGKPASLYADLTEGPPVVHPSDDGELLFQVAAMDLFDKSIARPFSAATSLFDLPVRTATTGLTPAKETSIVDDANLGYSVKLLSTTSGTAIYQDIPSYAALRGKPVTAAVKVYRPADAPGSVGRAGLTCSAASGTVSSATRAFAVQQQGFIWWVISGFMVPADATSLRLTLYHDTAASPSTSGAFYDQAVLVAGHLPRSAR